MHILHVVGARPNFMKVAPVMAALRAYSGISQTLVHTGQHYDPGMSDVFFHELGLPAPDANLGVGSGSHATQIAEIMLRFEKLTLEKQPDLVLVYGDVNSTVAAALVAAKVGIPLAHVEAGLRSFDRTMPEEINRIVTDQLADVLLTPSADADQNLIREGIPPARINRVGNVMIDTLVRLLPTAEKRGVIEQLGLAARGYCLVTLHRPANVDAADMLRDIFDALIEISRRLPVVFPVHPRTRARLLALGLQAHAARFHLLEPLGYLDFLALEQRAALVITDSGGVQEETTYLGVPCLTVRENTERPITVTSGTNTLVGRNMARLREEAARILSDGIVRHEAPPLWDGHTAERIAEIISDARPADA
jgi:UDP-N-acetylglucosamine 2-epimerase (non-hydrolysing)